MTVARELPTVREERSLPGADKLEEIVKRHVARLVPLIVYSVKALRKDGRPPFTEKLDPTERLLRALEAPPEFWEALQQTDPEIAAQLAADIIRARAKGQVPPVGPLADQAAQLPDEDETAPIEEPVE